ncbi:3,4-dihydroxy-2-butanone-4-phosphate synthase [Burkholderia ubonensis]|uniref:3,4-dihydroxy-2-butanone 4-phosphate synthase n=2 Tax=Burkholderia ubonensis TaxID=101571 RepID=A0AB74D9V8_9BURK|nr:3,4-dihydroxy-2-butanone-4-phosphate synthase [Burkholderia ubonensis]PAJ86963.1 3,4-dihydroxy-2-butanone-4-phosphate synthase [Burkholderia ubonensis]PAJ93854.1 3,4-dihydroxy-2-butanone-4-phosphate synthase [Burkholderia ubonensis]PAJ97499.1 3,4-dihydroxy-2-butanone-4-phosphate synthase [Burkholderia ubonensis]PAK07921.1 3,4-dihydroxy-2-butanone-4-phosphate synthase [Burkholderia ubonensis]
MALDRIEDALQAMARGSIVVVVDDEDRENEGDLILAAEHATPEAIAFMVRFTSGMLCVGLAGERLDELGLPLMVERNTDSMKTAYTITVDYRHGTTTGISAADRAATIRSLVDERATAGDFSRPGHVFPLRAVPGGVLHRPGHTEAAVDLARLAGLRPGAVLAEVVNDDGTMARRPELEAFARKHGLSIISIADLVTYRSRKTNLWHESAAMLPTRHGVFRAYAFRDVGSPHEHLALVLGDVAGREDVLVRVHAECLTGDTFGSLRCDCRVQLEASLAKIGTEGQGVLLYLRGDEGRGIGLSHELHAYAPHDEGLDTVDANPAPGLAVDAWNYAVGSSMLQELGITSMRLMTNDPAKYRGLTCHGLEIVERVPLKTHPAKDNHGYICKNRVAAASGSSELARRAEANHGIWNRAPAGQNAAPE